MELSGYLGPVSKYVFDSAIEKGPLKQKKKSNWKEVAAGEKAL